MTLRLPITTNRSRLGEIEITRTFTDGIAPGVHRYVWYVRSWTADGRKVECSSIVDHRESDGTLALLRHVLEDCGDLPLYEEGKQ